MDYFTTLHQLFEMEVKKAPQKNAIIYKKQVVSYQQLNQRANQLAHHLRSLGILPDKPVVVCIERSIEFFVAIIGILKAGGAYIPLDPSHPDERLLFIAQESEASLVVTTGRLKSKFSQYLGHVLLLDEPEISHQSLDNLEPSAKPHNLAYVIYTSGSTGTPKGVLIEHQGVVNYAHWFAKECIQGAKEKIDCSSNTAFDFALTLTIVPLMLGLTVVICEEAVKKDPRRYIEYLQANSISLIKITPSYFKVLLYELQNNTQSFPRLKKIMLAGENLATHDCIDWLERYPQHQLYNEYGPTETSVAVSLFCVDKENVRQLGEIVPIGYIIPDASFFILNEDLNPVVEGEAGELHLGGSCVARGYLNNPKLTSEYFIPDPVNKERILYKTGDLCRLLPNGALDCLGRIDHQLKIRGFRVELEEIEHCLTSHPAIKAAVVIASDKYSKEKRLIAYYLTQEKSALNDQELKKHLARFLPDYMIPSYYIKMEQFPLNANEKLDRAALPMPQESINPNYIAPKKLIEKKLAQIWQEELGIEKIGIYDNFFELGGHSLTAARVISKINYRFKKEINLQSLYQAPTIVALCPIVKTALRVDDIKIDLDKWKEHHSLPLSDFQLMLWLADTFEPKAKKLNIFTRKQVEGHLDLEKLNQAFAALLKKHPILSYRVSKFQPNQYLQKHKGFTLGGGDLTSLSDADSAAIIERSFEELKNFYPWPKNKPQILARVFFLKNKLTEIQLSMPHLITDDVCPEILLKDLSAFYCQPKALPVPSKNTYKEYVAQEQHYFNQHLEEDSKFWDEYFKDTQLFTFPEQHIVANMEERELPYSTYLPMTEEAVEGFKDYCAQNHISMLDGLCAVLATTLIEHTVPSPHAHSFCINRVKSTRDHEDYDQTIGCFLRLEPIKHSLTAYGTVATLAQDIHEAVMKTAPFQKCSNLIKLASLTNFRHQHNIVKQYSIKLGIWLYSTLTGQQLNSKILSHTSRLSSVKGSDFLINVNVHNSFLAKTKTPDNEKIFGLKIKPIGAEYRDILAIDNVLDVCFLKLDNHTPYLVLSANLDPDFRETLINKMRVLIEHPNRVNPKARASRLEQRINIS